MVKLITVSEQFSIECRKTKTKGITLANHKRHRQLLHEVVISSISSTTYGHNRHFGAIPQGLDFGEDIWRWFSHAVLLNASSSTPWNNCLRTTEVHK